MLRDGVLRCDMREDCDEPVTMLENKGWIYCTDHGIGRRDWPRNKTRKLRPYEVNKLLRGEALTRY